jgi:hypothetical protein
MILRSFALIMAGLCLANISLAAKTKKSDCEQMDSMAESVMKARQTGVPMATIYKITVTGDDYTSRIFKMLIEGAYKESRFSTEKYQEKAVVDYRNLIFLACTQNNDEKK